MTNGSWKKGENFVEELKKSLLAIGIDEKLIDKALAEGEEALDILNTLSEESDVHKKFFSSEAKDVFHSYNIMSGNDKIKAEVYTAVLKGITKVVQQELERFALLTGAPLMKISMMASLAAMDFAGVNAGTTMISLYNDVGLCEKHARQHRLAWEKIREKLIGAFNRSFSLAVKQTRELSIEKGYASRNPVQEAMKDCGGEDERGEERIPDLI